MDTVFLTLIAMAALCALGMVIAAAANAFVWIMERYFPVAWSRWVDRFVPRDEAVPGIHDLEEEW